MTCGPFVVEPLCVSSLPLGINCRETFIEIDTFHRKKVFENVSEKGGQFVPVPEKSMFALVAGLLCHRNIALAYVVDVQPLHDAPKCINVYSAFQHAKCMKYTFPAENIVRIPGSTYRKTHVPLPWASVHWLVQCTLECLWLTQCTLGYHWATQRILVRYTGLPLEKLSWKLGCHWRNS